GLVGDGLLQLDQAGDGAEHPVGGYGAEIVERALHVEDATGRRLQRAEQVVADAVGAGVDEQRLAADIGVNRRAGDLAVLQHQVVDGAVAGDIVAVVVEDVAGAGAGDGAADQAQLAGPGELERADVSLQGAVDLDAVGGIVVDDRAGLDVEEAAGGGDDVAGVGQRGVEFQGGAVGGLQFGAGLVGDGLLQLDQAGDGAEHAVGGYGAEIVERALHVEDATGRRLQRAEQVVADAVDAGVDEQRLAADIGVNRRAGDLAVLQHQVVDGAVAGDIVAVVVEDVAGAGAGDGAADQAQLAGPGELERADVSLQGAVDLDAVGGIVVDDRAGLDVEEAAGGGDDVAGVGQRGVEFQGGAVGGLQFGAGLVGDGLLQLDQAGDGAEHAVGGYGAEIVERALHVEDATGRRLQRAEQVVADAVGAGVDEQRLAADIGVNRRAGDLAVLQHQVVDGAVAGDIVAVVVEDVAGAGAGDGAADQAQLAGPGELERADVNLQGAVDLDAVGGIVVDDRAGLDVEEAAGGGDDVAGVGQRGVEFQGGAVGGLQFGAGLVGDGLLQLDQAGDGAEHAVGGYGAEIVERALHVEDATGRRLQRAEQVVADAVDAGVDEQRLAADIGVNRRAGDLAVLQHQVVDGAVAGDIVAVVVEDVAGAGAGDGAADQAQLAGPGELERADVNLQGAVDLDAVGGIVVDDRAGLDVEEAAGGGDDVAGVGQRGVEFQGGAVG